MRCCGGVRPRLPRTSAKRACRVQSARARRARARARDLARQRTQVGLLALQGSAYTEVATYPLDVLGAQQTEGMIGYNIIEQELGNELPFERHLATLLTMIEVDAADPAFANPTKPIGPLYDADEAARLEGEKGWTFKPDGDNLRRVVPSPGRSGSSRSRRSRPCSNEVAWSSARGAGDPDGVHRRAHACGAPTRRRGGRHRQGPRKAHCSRSTSRPTCSQS